MRMGGISRSCSKLVCFSRLALRLTCRPAGSSLGPREGRTFGGSMCSTISRNPQGRRAASTTDTNEAPVTGASTDPPHCTPTRDMTRDGAAGVGSGFWTCYQWSWLADTPGRRNRRPTSYARRRSWAPLRGTPGVNGFRETCSNVLFNGLEGMAPHELVPSRVQRQSARRVYPAVVMIAANTARSRPANARANVLLVQTRGRARSHVPAFDVRSQDIGSIVESVSRPERRLCPPGICRSMLYHSHVAQFSSITYKELLSLEARC